MFDKGAKASKPAGKPAAQPAKTPVEVDRSAAEITATVKVTVQAVYRDRAEKLLADAVASCNGKIAGATFEVA